MQDERRQQQAGRDRIEGEAPRLDVVALSRAISGLRLGSPLIYFPALPSTNTHAMELARAGATEGTLVTTDEQTAGRGRVGRVWRSPAGQQLALSLVLRPQFPPYALVMASALAVVGAVERVAGLRSDIKWPNDVLVGVNGRKVCGILVESSAAGAGDPGFAVLGIGLNVNGSFADDRELAERATTLEQEAGQRLAREALAAALLAELDASYWRLSGGPAALRDLRDRWRERLITRGRRVTIRSGVGGEDAPLTGVAEDVTNEGALLLRRDDGALQTVTWGDVE